MYKPRVRSTQSRKAKNGLSSGTAEVAEWGNGREWVFRQRSPFDRKEITFNPIHRMISKNIYAR